MREIELSDIEWSRLVRLFYERGSRALADIGYEPPVKLTHKNEFCIYEREADQARALDDSEVSE